MTNSLANRSVLVVEDDYDVREAVACLLEDLGMTVLAAADGKEALEVLRSTDKPPSLILLDLMMPRMNGYQFRIRQSEDPRLAHIPVVVFSADGRVESGLPGLGNVPCLRKPIDLDELIAVILDQLAPAPEVAVSDSAGQV